MPAATTITSSGFIAVVASEDHKSASAVEVVCETPWAAQTLAVINLASHAARLLLHNPNIDFATAGEHNLNIAEVSQRLGQAVHIGRFVSLANGHPDGRVAAYAPHSGNIAVLVSITGACRRDMFAHELCLQIVTHVPPPIVVSKKELPAGVSDEYALLEQRFVRDPAKSVAQVLFETGCRIEQFVRLEPGR